MTRGMEIEDHDETPYRDKMRVKLAVLRNALFEVAGILEKPSGPRKVTRMKAARKVVLEAMRETD